MNIQKFAIVAFNLLDRLCGLVTPYLTLLVLERFLPIRGKRWVKPLLYVGCFFFTEMPIYVGDPVNIFGALFAFFLAVFLCCEGTFLQRFSIVLILSSFNLSFNALTNNFFLIYLPLSLSTGSCFGFVHLFIWLIAFLLLRRFVPKQENDLPPRLWALVDVLTLTPFAVTLITVVMGDISEMGIDVKDILLLSVAVLTSFGLLWAVAVLAQSQKIEQEKSFYEMNRMHYKNLEQEQFQVRRLRHDMANHLQAMSALPEPELRKYIGELIHSPAMEHGQTFCENSVVNIVLSSKVSAMERSGIRAEISATLPQKLPVQDADLCALFANSIDNAIEACEKLPEEERGISVKATAQKGLFALEVQNPMKNKSIRQNGLPVTTKRNDRTHGFGLSSIREIAERHGGSMDISEENGQFSLLVCFPL